MLTQDQLKIQSLFKSFFEELMKDAATNIGCAVRIKADLQLGILDQDKKEKALAYSKTMQEMIEVIEKEQRKQELEKFGPTGILAQ